MFHYCLIFFHHIFFYMSVISLFLQRDKSPDPTDSAPPSLEICVNPSMFTVYSTVRQSILEQCMKEATQIYHQSQSLPSDSDSDDDREDKNKEGPIKLPKVNLDRVSSISMYII